MKIPPLSKLGIVHYPDPILKKKAVEVVEFGKSLQALAAHMLDLMKRNEGVGLAAPQIGLGIRLFVCNATGESADSLVCINPTIVEASGVAEREEGCLSIPGATVNVRRAARVLLRAYDAQGHEFHLEQSDLPARIWQHEIDHLEGKLIIDNMSTEDEFANRRTLKQLHEQYQSQNRKKR